LPSMAWEASNQSGRSSLVEFSATGPGQWTSPIL
jgi:hypothetical protein